MVEKRQSGQRWRPLTAAEHNAVAETADDYMRRRRLGQAGDSNRHDPDPTVLFLKNKSGGTRRRGEILELDKFLADKHLDADGFDFEGKLTTGSDNFGILRVAAVEDYVAKVQLIGDVIARVNVTDNAHKFAIPVAGEAVLQSAGAGPVRILWKPDPPPEEDPPQPVGDVECVVLMGLARVHWFCWVHVDVMLPNDRSAICSIRSLPPGQVLADVPDIGKDPAPAGTIKVCDPLGCQLVGPAEDHVGRQGWAVYSLPLQPTLCQPQDPDPEAPPIVLKPEWMFVDLCCPVPACDTQGEPEDPPA